MSEEVEAYWARKRAELNLLARAADCEAPTVTTGEELLAAKLTLRSRLLARLALDHPDWTESSYLDREAGSTRFIYDYQRFGLRLEGDDEGLYAQVYGSAPASARSCGVWGASGMAVMTATLRALEEWVGRPTRLLYSEDAYFETFELLQRSRALLPNTDEDVLLAGDILLLDSSALEERWSLRVERGSLERLSLVLFDTTCYDIASALVSRVVEEALAAGVPVACVRSHLKLDCFGTEHGRLGSLVLVTPSNDAQRGRAVALRDLVCSELVRSGAMAQPAAFWPLAQDPIARALTSERVRQMARANRAAAECLRRLLPRELQLHAPHHGCFVVVSPLSATLEEARPALFALARQLSAAGIEVRRLPSFGYDVAALTALNRLGGLALRAALPDWPLVWAERFAGGLARSLASLGAQARGT